MDSRYTHHLTSKMENLGLHSEYTGPEEVTLRDGKSIPISRIGSNIISVDSNKYKLDNILHGPASSSNLLSVLQFTNSNDVSVDLFPNFFIIKESLKMVFINYQLRHLLFVIRCLCLLGMLV